MQYPLTHAGVRLFLINTLHGIEDNLVISSVIEKWEKFCDEHLKSEYKDLLHAIIENKKLDHYKKTDYCFFKYINCDEYHACLKVYKHSEDRFLWFKRLLCLCGAIKLYIDKYSEDENVILTIAGSNNTDSDIDVGVFYKTYEKSNKSRHFIKFIENHFLSRHYTSLDLDIELYGDYIWKLNSKNELIPKITEFSHDTYVKCLPIVVCGMMRNFYQSIIDKSNKCYDVRRLMFKELDDNPMCSLTEKKLWDYLHNTESVLKYCKENIDINFDMNLTYKTIKSALNEINVYGSDKSAKIMFNKLINRNYINSINTYYKKLDICRKDYIANDNDKLCYSVSDALLHRAESYIFPTTVYMIVYKYQMKKDYVIKDPKHRADVYTISLLENLGYLLRFYNAYNPNTTKKNKKLKKYLSRILLSVVPEKGNMKRTRKAR
tara:strand:+ start:313 stop:1614 length:1302 start_codon:yes stop_codon:yes gene_type:complete